VEEAAKPAGHLLSQFGNANDAYWMTDNAWGSAGMTEGTAANQYEPANNLVDGQPARLTDGKFLSAGPDR
jgi:hypothetical protein